MGSGNLSLSLLGWGWVWGQKTMYYLLSLSRLSYLVGFFPATTLSAWGSLCSGIDSHPPILVVYHPGLSKYFLLLLGDLLSCLPRVSVLTLLVFVLSLLVSVLSLLVSVLSLLVSVLSLVVSILSLLVSVLFACSSCCSVFASFCFLLFCLCFLLL